MKWLSGVGLLIFLAVMVYWMSAAGGGDSQETQFLPIAFGNPTEDRIEMNVIVGVVLAHHDRKQDANRNKPFSWADWVKDHFTLTDADGNEVEFQRRNNSKIINSLEQQKMVGTPEFFLTAPLAPGQDYCLAYTPVVADGTTYEYRFTAPAQTQRVEQKTLERAP